MRAHPLALATLGALSLAACGKHAPAPTRTTAAPSVTIDLSGHAPVPSAPWDGGEPLASPLDAGLADSSTPRRPPIAGPWQRRTRVTLAEATVHASWDDPPDLDGDDLPDQLFVVECRSDMVLPTRGAHVCPSPESDEVGGPGRPVRVALVAFFSSEGAPVVPAPSQDGPRLTTPLTDAAPRAGHLVDTRRVWSAVEALPGRSLGGLVRFEFSEFGPGVAVHTVIGALPGDTTSDTLDVADLYVGVGLAQLAGTLARRCVRAGEAPERASALAIAWPAMTPLVWRAAMAHPFQGCSTRAPQLETSLEAPLVGGVTVTVAERAPVSRRASVSLAVLEGELQVVERPSRGGSTPDAGDGGPSWVDPLDDGTTRVTEVTRRCGHDRVRYERQGARCQLQVPREDGPLPGCQDRYDPALDPTAPRPLALLEGRLALSRGDRLLSVEVPPECSRSGRRAHATPWQGALPAGLAVSPEGTRTLVASGQDLWLYTELRRTPFLLNPPGGPLPRGTVRAVAFRDGTHAAAVISSEVVRFEFSLPAEPTEPPVAL